MVDRPPLQRARSASAAPPASTPAVFLSYAHAEADIAKSFREALGSRGLRVIIDVEHLAPGEDIAEFARRSIHTTDATVCLVSAASLSSAWVVFEAVTTLQREHADPEARLITCATDLSFFDHGTRLAITSSINDRLAEIDLLVRQYLDERLDFTDLSMERSRLISMRGGLGDVLARSRNCLTLDLKPDTLESCATRIANHIRGLRGLQPSRNEPRDIRARAEELRRHLGEGRTDDALDRMLDFVREFSDDPRHIRDVTVYSNTLRRVELAEKGGTIKFGAAEEQRQPTIYKLLVLIDEIELYPRLPAAS